MIKEFPFRIDHKLKHKLDILVKQLDKKDVWILIDGDEGAGKTNTLAYLLTYFSCATGRELTQECLYFDTEKLLNYFIANKSKLLGWDEAALGGLSTEWYNRSQINLIKASLVGRIKHHVFIMCIPRFEKLKEELRQDRIHALIHMDCGKKNDKYGHYAYLTRRGIDMLNKYWREKKLRLYGKCCRKYGGFFGDLPYVFNKVFDEDKYNEEKEKAIYSIGKKDISKDKQDLKELKYKISKAKPPILTIKEFAEKLGISAETLHAWGRNEANNPEKATPSLPEVRLTDNIYNNGVQGDSLPPEELVNG